MNDNKDKKDFKYFVGAFYCGDVFIKEPSRLIAHCVKTLERYFEMEFMCDEDAETKGIFTLYAKNKVSTIKKNSIFNSVYMYIHGVQSTRIENFDNVRPVGG